MNALAVLPLLLSLGFVLPVEGALNLEGVILHFNTSLMLKERDMEVTASGPTETMGPTTEETTTEGTMDLTTSESGTTTPPPTPSNGTLTHLQGWLYELYEDETGGFIDLITNWTSGYVQKDSLPYFYQVSYAVSELNLEPVEDSELPYELQRELEKVSGMLGDWADPDYIWEVDMDNTDQSDDIEAVGEYMDSGCDYYGKDVCPADEICYMEEVEKSDYKNVTCMNKCEHFTSVQGHCTKNFIASGECVLIGEAHDPYPYCDCGSWALMDDWYDGDTCVSASFVVGMAAGLGALVLLVLFILAIWLAAARSSSAKELEEAKYGFPSDNPFDESQKDVLANGSAHMEMTSQPEGMTENDPEDYDNVSYHTERDVAEKNETKQQGYENRGYLPSDTEPTSDVHRDKDAAGLYSSDPFANFEPSLEHVDPDVDYSIKRPNIVMRPMAPYTNVQSRSEWDHRL